MSMEKNLITFTAEELTRLSELVKIRTHRLEDLAQPETWESLTRHLEGGERRRLEQSCRDDELTIKALQYVLQATAQRKPDTVKQGPGLRVGVNIFTMNGPDDAKKFCDAITRSTRAGLVLQNCGVNGSGRETPLAWAILARPEMEAEANGPV